MHKVGFSIAHDIRPERPRSKVLRTASIIVLGVLLAGPAVEVGSLCYGRFCQVLGVDTEARTPILDSVHDGLQDAHQSVWNCITPYFHRVPWNPNVVLPIAALVMVLAMVMMKI